ncbi:uncharacterized protein TNCV_231831 [Trichonephila clavipes]|nr:uncharacterized protein TNCV_231831 [Trichonephila clavipes]
MQSDCPLRITSTGRLTSFSVEYKTGNQSLLECAESFKKKELMYTCHYFVFEDNMSSCRSLRGESHRHDGTWVVKKVREFLKFESRFSFTSRDAPSAPFSTPAPVSCFPEGTGSNVILHYLTKLLTFLNSNFRFLFPTQKTPGTHFAHSKKFKVKPYQEVFKIRSSDIVQQRYGYIGDSKPRNTPGTDISCSLLQKIRFCMHTDIPTFCEFSRFPDSTPFRQ